MHRILLTSLMLFPAATSLAGSPIAEVVCAPTEEMRSRLTLQFGEVQQGAGLRAPDQVMELWSGKDGSWTLVMTYASGQSCIVAMGETWDGPSRQIES